MCERWGFSVLFLSQGGELVKVLREPNAPLLQKMIVEELANEKLVLEKKLKRIVVSLSHNKYVYFTRILSSKYLIAHYLLSQVKDDALFDKEVQEDTGAQQHYEDSFSICIIWIL